MLYYDIKGFHSEQDETNSRYEITEETRDSLFEEINNRTHEDNLYQWVGIIPDVDGSPKVSLIPRTVEEQKEIIRRLRANRVFPIINRSNFWYNTLTETQKQELQTWYQAWLDATETLVLPDRPSWLK